MKVYSNAQIFSLQIKNLTGLQIEIGSNCPVNESAETINYTRKKAEATIHTGNKISAEIVNYDIYRKKAAFWQQQVYNEGITEPNKDCAKFCKDVLKSNPDKEFITEFFALHEGLADVLRTRSHSPGNFKLYEHPVYECMEMLSKKTCFPVLTHIIHTMRYAAALAASKCDEEADKYADQAMERIKEGQFLSNEEIAWTNASNIYGFVNVKLERYSNSSETAQKCEILKWINQGFLQAKRITILEEKNMWTRMFLVKKAFCLLEIGLHSEDLGDSNRVTKESKLEAKRCIDEVHAQFWNGTDNRREMLVLRAESKFEWLEGHHHMAKQKLKQALSMAKGKFKREEVTMTKILDDWERNAWTEAFLNLKDLFVSLGIAVLSAVFVYAFLYYVTGNN